MERFLRNEEYICKPLRVGSVFGSLTTTLENQFVVEETKPNCGRRFADVLKVNVKRPLFNDMNPPPSYTAPSTLHTGGR